MHDPNFLHIQINHKPDATIFQFIYPDVYLHLNMFRAFSRPSSGAQWLQWHPLVLPLYRGDSRAVFVVGPADWHYWQIIRPVTTDHKANYWQTIRTCKNKTGPVLYTSPDIEALSINLFSVKKTITVTCCECVCVFAVVTGTHSPYLLRSIIVSSWPLWFYDIFPR
jgi:hypothetical protein